MAPTQIDFICLMAYLKGHCQALFFFIYINDIEKTTSYLKYILCDDDSNLYTSGNDINEPIIDIK